MVIIYVLLYKQVQNYCVDFQNIGWKNVKSIDLLLKYWKWSKTSYF